MSSNSSKFLYANLSIADLQIMMLYLKIVAPFNCLPAYKQVNFLLVVNYAYSSKTE